jgi:hypothetical protein
MVKAVLEQGLDRGADRPPGYEKGDPMERAKPNFRNE